MHHRHVLATVLIAILLPVGCGFHLRGTESIPDALAPLGLDCVSRTPRALCSEVRSELERYGLLAEAGTQPAHILRLSGYEQDRRTSAITDRAATAEYEVRVGVTLNMTSSDGVALLRDARLSTREVFRADEQRVLAEEREQRGVEALLQQELAQKVARRLTPLTAGRIRLLREEHKAKNSGGDNGS